MFYFKGIKKIFLALSFLSILGCTRITNHGKYLENVQIEELRNRIVSSEELVSLLGTPSFISKISENKWYYISFSTAKKSFLPVKIVKQRVVKITLDNNLLSEITVNDNLPNNIYVTRNYTKPKIVESSVIKRYIDNMAIFKKFTKKAKRR